MRGSYVRRFVSVSFLNLNSKSSAASRMRNPQSTWLWLLFGSLILILSMHGLDLPTVYADEERMQSEPKLSCCIRQQKMVNIGQSVSGEDIKVDVGRCKKMCPKNPYDDPGDPSKPAVQKCQPKERCQPVAERLERMSTRRGMKSIRVVDSCTCVPGGKCRRESFQTLVYSGTPYQILVDTGVCLGHCERDLGCRPERNSSIGITGPNGQEIHSVIEKCSCTSSCHKMDRMETVMDYSFVEMSKGVDSIDVRPVIRNINVGTCVGVCKGNSTAETCLLRDKKKPSRCLAGLYFKQHSCSPATFKVHEYRTRRGLRREIIQITSCACV